MKGDENRLKRLCKELGIEYHQVLREKLLELEARKRILLIPSQRFLESGGDPKEFAKKVLHEWNSNNLRLAKSLATSIGKRDIISQSLRNLVRHRDRNRCQVCGKVTSEEDAAVDHIWPVKYGGSTTPNNLQLLCKECNDGKGEFPYYAAGDPWLIEGLTPRLRYSVIMRNGRKCQKCGASYEQSELDIYLRVPRNQGRYIYDHLWTLCKECAKKTSISNGF